MKDKVRIIAPLVILLALLAAFLLPKYLENRAADQFGAPLFNHALPEDATLIQKDAAKTEEGGMMAALLLKTDLTSEALEAFYADVEAEPAQPGDTLILRAKALDESSVEALKQAKVYEEGASYQFVYLYSGPDVEAE